MSTLFQSAEYYAPTPTETEFRRAVVERLRSGGWSLFMLPQQRRHKAHTTGGWPDIVAVRGPRMWPFAYSWD